MALLKLLPTGLVHRLFYWYYRTLRPYRYPDESLVWRWYEAIWAEGQRRVR